MAKIGLGVTVGMIRGKAGGAVFTKARNGSTLRIRVSPANPQSGPQLNARGDITLASRKFKGLSAANLALWAAYAEAITVHDGITGSSYHPSGISEFTKLGAKFLQITPGGTIPSAPPTTPYTPDTVTVTAVGGAGLITYTGSADNAAGSKTEILLQKLVSVNRLPNPKGYRHQTFSAVPLGTPVVVNHLASDTTHPAAPLPAGEYIPAYRMVKTSTGEAGPLVVLPAVAVT